MKIIKAFSLLILLAFISAPIAFGHQSHHRHNHYSNATGAPLDGGILSILGVAGVAYYAARKKKNNPAA